jgi:antitoxin (DNA-binding transcriptional repressor) of toxin-antitoxin stability system
MSTITVQQIQSDFAGFLRRVEAGESFLLVEGDQPLAEVRPIVAMAKQPRPYGLCAGHFKVPADFDEPLPEDILNDFEGQ